MSAKKKQKIGKPVFSGMRNTSKSSKKTTEVRALFAKADASSDSEREMVLDDDSDLDADMDDIATEKDEIRVGDFVLVAFVSKKKK